MSKKFLPFCVVTLMILSSVSLFAQATAGGLAGTITDASGAALPGVTVELSGPAMQGTRTATTDARGEYRFVNTPPGENYRVTATLAGFQSQTKTVAHVYL